MERLIVLVEDEEGIADSVIYRLKTEGMTVEWFSSGGDALEFVKTRSPDLMILDVGLPDWNGFDLCREIRKTSDVPIIFLTARSDEIDRIVGLELGADDYVVKPFSPRELAARVKAVLRRQIPPSSPAVAEVDTGFELEDHKMKICYCGRPLDLSRYEFLLLRVLIRRPGWVYSREKLMELVWDEPEMSTARTVDTHIKTIRSKLREVTPDVDPIQTHRGLGYSIREH